MQVTIEPKNFFAENFRLLTERDPYPWQKKLFLALIMPAGTPWPEEVDLPTGAGKTAVVYIWLIALAWSARCGTYTVPRRLAWIVNRRVVVDQVTTELTALLKRVNDTTSGCGEISQLLAGLSVSGKPLAVSTLRGQYADNGDWSRDLSAPAVVVGTVDMLGSRLLFRGYRAGPYFRPIHAGMLGVDTLIVNDEAHLSPALAQLLEKVRDRMPASQVPGKSFRILVLSATPDRMDGLRRFDHDPAEDVAASPIFSRIFNAPKSLVLREVSSSNESDAAIWSLATQTPVPRTAIFVEQPERAAKLAERLEKDNRRCALLTGTMRGFERDSLLDGNETFRRFLAAKSDGEPVWLVCTSAGEVGINFSCERMITGLVEADHLLQRFGRLNRFGETDSATAYVVFRNPSEKEVKFRETLSYLRGLDGNVSCARVWGNRPQIQARSDRPILARLEDRHIDLWAQTTQHDRSVPPVASWLHGKQDAEAPDTEVVWRSDVGALAELCEKDIEQIEKVLEYYPVLAREKLSEPAARVAGKLAEIEAHIGLPAAGRKKLIVVESDGTPSVFDLASLVKQTSRDENFLGNKMLLLPNGIGSVRKGMFHSAAPDSSDETVDVADPETKASNPSPTRIRFDLRDGASTRVPTHAESSNEISGPNALERAVLEAFATDNDYRAALVVRHPEYDDRALVYFGARSSGKWGKPTKNVSLDDHQASVAIKAKELIDSLRLPEFASLYERAGAVHDAGKARPVWQRAMGGSIEHPIAKAKAPVNLRLIAGYRHELGSLLDALKPGYGGSDDLLLHLVASHHAAARPFFHAAQYDPTGLKDSRTASAEVVRRYARLQARYGHWGLAYLEAIFKCADGIVSSQEGESESA